MKIRTMGTSGFSALGHQLVAADVAEIAMRWRVSHSMQLDQKIFFGRGIDKIREIIPEKSLTRLTGTDILTPLAR